MKFNFNSNFTLRLFKVFLFLSLVLSILSLFVHHLRLSIDFTGGNIYNILVVSSLDNLRSILHSIDPDYILQKIQLSEHYTLVINNNADFSNLNDIKIVSSKYFGSKFGSDLLKSSIISIFLASFSIFIYLFIKYGIVLAVVSLFFLLSNIFISLGLCSIFHIEISVMIIAAFLTLLGYCINDTVVILDRIKSIIKNKTSFNDIVSKDDINLALYSVVKRSLITSVVTFLAITPLLFVISQDIRNFAIILIIGILNGTLFSLFTAPFAASIWIIKIPIKDQSKRNDPMRFI